MLLLNAVPMFAAENQEDSHQQAAMASGGSVSIDNGRGDLWLEGTDQLQLALLAFHGAQSFHGPTVLRGRHR